LFETPLSILNAADVGVELFANRVAGYCRQPERNPFRSLTSMNQEIRSKLDRICNILWSGVWPCRRFSSSKSHFLIYLKLLDEREAELELKSRLLKGKNGNTTAVPPIRRSR